MVQYRREKVCKGKLYEKLYYSFRLSYVITVKGHYLTKEDNVRCYSSPFVKMIEGDIVTLTNSFYTVTGVSTVLV